MNDADSIENFFGVYMLYCQNPKFKGRIYIGYTVDPNRRIQQHNKGKEHGGARKTNNKGPWSMVMIVHGFPNDISAYRFEWAWQHPHISRRLRHVEKKKQKEKLFDFHFRILSEMLIVPPWCRLPLVVRWLNHNFIKEFPIEKKPPSHMIITSGQVISKKIENLSQNCSSDECDTKCDLCQNLISEKKLYCLNIFCDLVCHIKCLADIFLEYGEYLPVEGKCPKCDKVLLWGDIVNKYKGYNNKDITINLDDDSI